MPHTVGGPDTWRRGSDDHNETGLTAQGPPLLGVLAQTLCFALQRAPQNPHNPVAVGAFCSAVQLAVTLTGSLVAVEMHFVPTFTSWTHPKHIKVRLTTRANLTVRVS